MKKPILSLLLILLIIISFSHQSFSQIKDAKNKKETRNNWGLGFVYSENGFGFSSGLYAPVSRSIDFYLNLHFSGVSDSREIQRYDIYGNSVTLGKVNRVYMMPLSIGLNKELFKGDIEGNFRPSISFGVAPTLVMYNPYDRSFFNAIAYTKTKFAFGPYAGIGINYKQSKSTSLNINLSYYYLPITGGGVESIENSEIKDVGGLQLTFGLNFMK